MYASVKAARLVYDYVVECIFEDGLKREIDLKPFLRGEIYEPLLDYGEFQKFTVDEVGGTIVWPNGADIAPETLYYDLGPVPHEERTR